MSVPVQTIEVNKVYKFYIPLEYDPDKYTHELANETGLLMCTRQGKEYQSYIGGALLDVANIPISDTTHFCFNCNAWGYKYSCPDYGINLNKHFRFKSKKYPYMFMVWLRASTKDIDTVFKHKIAHTIMFGEKLLKYAIERWFFKVEAELGYGYSTGSCWQCFSKACSKTIGKPCRHPERMRYALEAVWINCTKIMEDLGIPLFWYQAGSGVLPPYFVKVVGFLTNKDEITCNKVLHDVVSEDWALVRRKLCCT